MTFYYLHRYHFKQLAEDNKADNYEIIKNEDINPQDIPNIKYVLFLLLIIY